MNLCNVISLIVFTVYTFFKVKNKVISTNIYFEVNSNESIEKYIKGPKNPWLL